MCYVVSACCTTQFFTNQMTTCSLTCHTCIHTQDSPSLAASLISVEVNPESGGWSVITHPTICWTSVLPWHDYFVRSFFCTMRRQLVRHWMFRGHALGFRIKSRNTHLSSVTGGGCGRMRLRVRGCVYRISYFSLARPASSFTCQFCGHVGFVRR